MVFKLVAYIACKSTDKKKVCSSLIGAGLAVIRSLHWGLKSARLTMVLGRPVKFPSFKLRTFTFLYISDQVSKDNRGNDEIELTTRHVSLRRHWV